MLAGSDRSLGLKIAELNAELASERATLPPEEVPQAATLRAAAAEPVQAAPEAPPSARRGEQRRTREQPRAVERGRAREQPRAVERGRAGEQPRAVERGRAGEQPRAVGAGSGRASSRAPSSGVGPASSRAPSSGVGPASSRAPSSGGAPCLEQPAHRSRRAQRSARRGLIADDPSQSTSPAVSDDDLLDGTASTAVLAGAVTDAVSGAAESNAARGGAVRPLQRRRAAGPRSPPRRRSSRPPPRRGSWPRGRRPRPRASRRQALFRELAAGSYRRDERLIKSFAPRDDRSREALAVRRMQAHLRLGDRGTLERLQAAAIADKNMTYARAIEHVLRARR